MTVKLLSQWGEQPAGTLFTADPTTEAAMIAANHASSTLTGGVVWVPPGGSLGKLAGYLIAPCENTIYTAGDSLSANGLIVTGSNFISRASEGVFNWFDAFLGGAFVYVGNIARPGKTVRQMIDEQFPIIAALAVKPKYLWLTGLINDLYAEAVAVDVGYSRMVEAVQDALAMGCIPIWSTCWSKSYDVVATAKAVQVNDLLRRFSRENTCGLFWDAAAFMNDPTDSNNQGRTPLASYYYDSTTHPNNMFAMQIGRYAAQQLSDRIPQQNSFSVGNEDLTFSGATSNLLSNPSFIGSGAASGTGITGVFPTGWKVDWATRTGGGSAACAIVPISDPATGLQIANAIEVTLSGAAAANDVLRIYQSDTENAGLRTNLTTGSVVQSEAMTKVASGANLSNIYHRILTNGSESTGFGGNIQTAVAYPATIPAIGMRSFPQSVLGSGVATAARHDLRITFNGAGTGTVITMWRPRFRKLA